MYVIMKSWRKFCMYNLNASKLKHIIEIGEIIYLIRGKKFIRDNYFTAGTEKSARRRWSLRPPYCFSWTYLFPSFYPPSHCRVYTACLSFTFMDPLFSFFLILSRSLPILLSSLLFSLTTFSSAKLAAFLFLVTLNSSLHVLPSSSNS